MTFGDPCKLARLDACLDVNLAEQGGAGPMLSPRNL